MSRLSYNPLLAPPVRNPRQLYGGHLWPEFNRRRMLKTVRDLINCCADCRARVEAVLQEKKA